MEIKENIKVAGEGVKAELNEAAAEVKGHMEAVRGLVKKLEKQAYSGFRDVAIGGLKTAVDNLQEHIKALEKK